MKLTKLCCFNCKQCSTAPDNQLICRDRNTNEVLTHMSIEESCVGCCGKYIEDINMKNKINIHITGGIMKLKIVKILNKIICLIGGHSYKEKFFTTKYKTTYNSNSNNSLGFYCTRCGKKKK